MSMPSYVYLVVVTNGDAKDPTHTVIAERVCKSMRAAQNFGITKCDELWKQTATTAFDDFNWSAKAISYIDN